MENEIMNVDKGKKNGQGKREWVKPAAIIFLTVMLILTFFSNTIMNISLVEVSTQQVSSGSITTKIRGTGTVVTTNIYDVILDETRNVEEIKIAVGDTVIAGDVLFVLDESESTELKEARNSLDELKLAYKEAILSGGLSDYTAENTAVSRAEQALSNAKNERSAFGTSGVTVSQATEVLRVANVAVAEITAQKTSLENQLALLDDTVSDRTALESQIVQITSNLEAAEATVLAVQNTLNSETNIAAIGEVTASALEEAKLAVVEITAQKTSLENQLALLDEADGEQTALANQIAQVRSNLEGAEATARTAQNTLDNATNIAAADAAVEAAEQALEDAKLALVKVVETGEKQSAVNDLNLTAQQEKIAEQEEKVAKLQKNAVDRELTAKYGGIITAVNITAGKAATPDIPIAQIAVSEEGYSAEIIITKEQAELVEMGDTAEVTSNDWSAEITATVENIRSGVSDGNAGDVNSTDKTVVFQLEGEDLTIGEPLNFILSQSSTDYELLVPNSAVKTDSNGSFVLMITEKSAPLGTRYVATRVDVTVVERGEIYTAVSGSLAQYDSVITTASKIVEPSDYVRLTENN